MPAANTYEHVHAASDLLRAGMVRVDAYRGLVAVLREDGIDYREVLAEAGLDAGLLDDPENLAHYRDLERLTLHCERRTGCDYIGVRIGQRARLASFGKPGQLARCQATARAGLQAFVQHFNLHNFAATVSLVRTNGVTRFIFAICEPGMSDTRHLQMGAVTAAFNIVRDLCGPDWRATELAFACRPPSDLRPLQRVFRAPLRFDSDESAVAFEDHWLETALPPMDPGFCRAVESAIEAQRKAAMVDFPATVRRVLRKQLLLGSSSMDEAAALLLMHRRTLSRRLREHGVAYRELLDAVRRDTAQQLLHDTSLTVQQIAESLHFSSAANFATAFRRWSGLTPSAYRTKARRASAEFRLRGSGDRPTTAP